MGFILLIAMIGIPILEIAAFIEVGGWIGVGPTIAIVILTAVIGTALLRQQGLATLHRAQESLNQGAFPMEAVFDGLCLLVAGALLLTPGFFTDTVGFLLFLPPLRRLLRGIIGRRLAASGKITIFTDAPGAPNSPGDQGQGRKRGDPPIIEGEYTDVTRDDDRKDR